MPLFKCSKCHHEWESTKGRDTCSWCFSDGIKIRDLTEMELTFGSSLRQLVRSIRDSLRQKR